MPHMMCTTEALCGVLCSEHLFMLAQAVEVALVERQAALREQTVAVARHKAASAKQRVLARVYGKRRGGRRAVRTHG
jgi:hypothetical protein